MSASLVSLTLDDGTAAITLDRPERHNALVPALLDDLLAAIEAARSQDVFALTLTGRGRSFSTGGDIAGFLAARTDTADTAGITAYAGTLVAKLNDAILALAAFPAPVIAAVNGPVTGGSTGLVLAADIVLMTEDAFLQPYYVDVGFAPDGGWTALLPERIGAARAARIQMLNERIDAETAHNLGLADRVVARDRLPHAIAETLETLRAKEPTSLRTTRGLIWSARRREALRRDLEAERQAFLGLIGRDCVAERMRAFLGRH